MVYAIKCIPTNKLYVGYTTKSLWKCLGEHMRNARRITNGADNSNRSRRAVRLSNAIIEFGEYAFTIYSLEENIPEDQLRARADWWIRELKATDPRYGYNERGGRIIASSRAEYVKIYNKQYNAKWQKEHPENCRASTAKYSKTHREEINRRAREKYAAQKAARNAEYYNDHKDEIKARHVERSEAISNYDKLYYEAHREEILARAKARYAAKKAAKNNK